MEPNLTLTLPLTLTPRNLAEAFCNMNDEEQAQFFIECANLAAGWRREQGAAFVGMQWFLVGRHLRNCACSSDAARELVRDIASGIQEA